MKRLGRCAAIVGLLGLVSRAALATPFSDVPADRWADQYVESLAADGVVTGYPDGTFKGDRPLTRYEMAAVVARTIERLRVRGGDAPSKDDLEKLQKLIVAYKDELDALGVRVTSLEDEVAALDTRTKLAQSLSLHGVFLPNVTARERDVVPTTIVNRTGAAVTTYYGATIPGSANPNAPAVGPIDPFVSAFLATDPTNDPLTQALAGVQIRQDTRFTLTYALADDLTVSLPVHILNFEYGGEYAQQQKLDIEPSLQIAIARAGALHNLQFTYGQITDMASSLTGLTFAAPQGYDDTEPYVLPYQPYQKGISAHGTVGEGAFGLTDFQVSFTRLDQTLINTQPGVTDPSVAAFNANEYFTPVVPSQVGYVQQGAAASLRTDRFAAGAGTLGEAFLTQKAVAGSVYIASVDGETFDASGAPTGGAALFATAPPFTYVESLNAVVFNAQLPAGSTVSIAYRGLALANDVVAERYMIHARAKQTFAKYDGVEVGVSYNRIFDYDDLVQTGTGATAISQTYAQPASGAGLVSDAVLGLDVSAPIPVALAHARPTAFAEIAESAYTPDYRTIASSGDAAVTAGVRLHAGVYEFSAQYQSVGLDFIDGAPFGYFGNAPATFSDYRAAYLPGFFGFGNDVALNGQFDAQFARAGLASPRTAANPNLTFAYPIFDTLRASGPQYFSAFAPNSRGESFTANGPARLGSVKFALRAAYHHLEEISPQGTGATFYGPEYVSGVREHDDTYDAGTGFHIPALGRDLTTDLSATYEQLQRLDRTPQRYVPVDPGTEAFDAAAAAASAALPGGGSAVSSYPNYVDVRKISISAAAAFPITQDLRLAGSYTTQQYGGSFGTTLGQNISERKDYYQGSLTYSVPRTNSSLSFVASRYRYTDQVVPSYDFGQNRQDVNFTIRF